MEDKYFKLINSRKQSPLYRNRKVDIEYSFYRDRVVCRISDEGNEFDHAEIINKSEEEVNHEKAVHGRGISMAKKTFTHIKYNQKGNRVILAKNFNDYSL